MVYKRFFKLFTHIVAGLFIYLVFLKATPAFALSVDPQQHFTAASTSNWSLSCGGCGVTANYSFAIDTSGTYQDIYNGETTPLRNGVLQSDIDCSTCSVTLTYTDPSPGLANNYIEFDALTDTYGRAFQIIVTDTLGNSVTATNNDILVNCLSPPAVIQGTTNPGFWATLFIPTSSLGPVSISTVKFILPSGSANFMGTSGSDALAWFDNLRDLNNLPCLLSPTPTPTNSPTDTPTPTFTSTQTDTPTITPTPTKTFTDTPTLSPTQTFTSTATSSPSDTATKTATFTPTTSPTVTPSSTQTFTATNSPTGTTPFTSTPTNTPLFTSTNTFSATPTSTPSSTRTPTPTDTPLATFTNTFSPTPTSTFTITPTFTSTHTSTVTSTSTHTYTPTITNTPGPTSTFTQTPCPIVVYPDPMDFQHVPAYNNQCPGSSACIKFGCVPVGSTLKIYTVSLGLVRSFSSSDPNFTLASSLNVGTFTWDGNNGDGNPVSSGFYLYVVDGPGGRSFGKFAISRSWNGP